MPKNDVTGAPEHDKLDQHPKETLIDEAREGLVKVKKDGKTLHVHPSTVRAHEEAGWLRH